MTTNLKLTLLRNSSILFNFIQFVKCWRNFLGLNPKGSYLSLEKEKGSFVSCSSTPESGRVKLEVSRRSRATTAKKCAKKRNARAKFLFC